MITVRRSGIVCAVMLTLLTGSLAGCTRADSPADRDGVTGVVSSPTRSGTEGSEGIERQADDLLLTLGTQTRIGETTVGVMTATERDTGVIARLSIRNDDGESTKVVLSPGEEFSLFSEGDALLVDVLLDGGPEGSRAVLVRPLE